MQTVAIIGSGRWGKNIIRTVNGIADIKAIGYGGNPDTKEYLGAHYPDIHVTSDIKTIAEDTGIASVFIATPIDTHYEHTKLFLDHNKHVFVEKPLALTTPQVTELHTLAKEKHLVLFTGYVYLYNQALVALQKICTT